MSKSKGLYFLVLGLSLIVVIAAMGGGLFYQSAPWYEQWQHYAFLKLCHQIPERSFWINGQPMAVCSRCFGIYSSFTAGWIALPYISRLRIFSNIPAKTILLITFLLNIMDVAGNMAGYFENGLYSRLLLGVLLGLSVVMLFMDDFFNESLKSVSFNHARI